MRTRTLILTILTCLCSCTAFRDEIIELHKEIDNIKNEKIATINGQITNIQASISELEQYKAGIDGYIKDLQEQDRLLKEAIEAAKSSIRDNAGDIDNLEDRATQSETAINALEVRLTSVEEMLANLQDLNESLNGKIDSLKKYLDEELSKAGNNLKEWANATFCTLEQYYGVTDAITAINGNIASINASLTDMEKSISDLEEKLSAEIDSKLSAAISTAKAELEAAWTEDIEAAATALESSLKAWVNSQLEGYYTAAETDAKLESLQTYLEGKLESQKTYIEGLISNLGNTLNAQISSNASQIETLITDLSSLESYAQTNAANIAANSESISRNAQAILKNAQDIASISEEISGNIDEELEKIRQSVAANKSLIEENALLISSNTLSLSNLNSSFAKCSEEVKKNASAIASNSAAIAENANLIAANVSAIADNASAIAANTTEIEALKAELKEARQSIKDDYEAAISKAFGNAKSEITEIINVNVTEINERIDSEVSDINTGIAAIESRVTTLEQQLADLIGRVETLESAIETINTSITAVRDQISGINSTIEELKATDTSIKSAVETLENQTASLEGSLTEVNALIEQLQQDYQAGDSAVSSQLESLKSTVESKLSSIDAELVTLKSYDSSLNERITGLAAHVTELDSKISESESDTKAWAEATFATLAEYNATCEELAGVKTVANAAKTAVETLEGKVDKILSEDIPAALEGLEDELRTEIETKVNAMGTSLSEAVSTARSEITAAYESAISTAVSASEASMKTWINSKLALYYTAAEADAKLALTKQELESELADQKQSLERQIGELEVLVENNAAENADSLAAIRTRIIALQQKIDETTKSNAADIAMLQENIASAKQEITTAYQSAIESAITENNGLIDTKIATAISDANSTLNSKISDINSKLEALTSRVDVLETQVADIRTDLDGVISDMGSVKESLEEILSMIQSITVVPDYSDGCVNAKYGDSTSVDFEIFPLSAAEALAENLSGAVSIRAVYTEPATKSSHSFVDLPVSGVDYADGIVTVTYNPLGLGSDFWYGTVAANARLLISDGNNCVASQYYPLRPVLPELSSAMNLSSAESSNCYIVSSAGTYRFKTVKGNSSTSVGSVSSCEVLWESFGNSTAPEPGDLIPLATYKDGYILFVSGPSEGNAVIAAKDASGNILWSWHIWLTDEPQEQVYNNNAGTMMDRNLGATSATPGDVGALGLLYQWGRKDPFLNSSSVGSSEIAKSSIVWPTHSYYASSIDYVIAHPTTFISPRSTPGNFDWYSTGNSYTDNTRWQSSKTIYDPCPAGWRVPDGGTDGVWAKAFGSSDLSFSSSCWDSANYGMDFSKADQTLASSATIWYPASGQYGSFRSATRVNGVGENGCYWSVTPYGENGALSLLILNDGTVDLSNSLSERMLGRSVRCFKENSGSTSGEPGEGKVYTDISAEGTANCYIISENGDYKFKSVKGNGSSSVGTVASAIILWESFGTSETLSGGALIRSVWADSDYLYFSTADTFREGNAVIAARDASDNILWSWHIWLTDEPQEQVYNNNAGTMMDRNLGATSATPGDAGALGLFYQWGRKDPFPGSSSISSNEGAKTTIHWPRNFSSDNYTIAFATAHPTTRLGSNDDWYVTGNGSIDNTRWQSSKTIYDPCPSGWRVPDGGTDGVWAKAFGTGSEWTTESNWVFSNKGMDFSVTDKTLGSSGPIWYPAAGYFNSIYWEAFGVGTSGCCWTVSPDDAKAYRFHFKDDGCILPSISNQRAMGCSVRCFKENSGSSSGESGAGKVYSDISAEGTANCYIISGNGDYKFKAVKGNGSSSVGTVASASVLWESFGTSTAPSEGDLIKDVSYDSDGYISFSTADTFREGNAVIAAKDAADNILWSWHIWLTDEPQEQVYLNNAGTMMDRNLGATSATPGDVGALGLLYQWGRKDPFLGSSSISSDIEAKSTGTWPSAVSSNSTNGTIEYAIAYPTTFITHNSSNDDWYYTGSSTTDNTRWTTSTATKSIYDPCPSGWRVPDGGYNGIWSKALGASSYFTDALLYDSTNEGMNFSGKFGSDQTIWYPASGYRDGRDGSLFHVGDDGHYWSASPGSDYPACYLRFDNNGYVGPSNLYYRAYGHSVRCLQE